ncbi:phosphotransferase [Paenibacillus glycanilyticus]|uniref:phosphotransferase family protein n=1 Tax=Paenibacillus glycanilyticus TaxID=126569 RepID=UPI00203A3DE7|nr:phosphotransferase [Paenibacillus glycanilyticus]MCM3629625.1 phosphotransferase [Paenibacillus glycanilyticus]
MKTEVESMRLVADNPALPVPRIYTYDSSCELIRADYFVMEYVEGTALNKIRDSLAPEEREDIVRQLGGYSRTINAYKNSFFGSLQPGGRIRD